MLPFLCTIDSLYRITKFESFGFVYSAKLTNEARTMAKNHKTDVAPTGKTYNAQHLRLHLLVFINPTVASMPKHHHILSEHGCYVGRENNKIVQYECGTKNEKNVETPLPADFLPLSLNPEMDAAWEKLVFGETVQPNGES
jgi:hypothetical protein